jgi:hypothetical protein
MKLNVGLKNYSVQVIGEGRRVQVVVHELTKHNEHAGRTWLENYDTILGEKKELERRFNASIKGDRYQKIVKECSEDVDFFIESVSEIVDPILSIVANRMLEEMRERAKTMADGGVAKAAQAILEEQQGYLISKFHKKLPVLIEKIMNHNGHEPWWRFWRR